VCEYKVSVCVYVCISVCVSGESSQLCDALSQYVRVCRVCVCVSVCICVCMCVCQERALTSVTHLLNIYACLGRVCVCVCICVCMCVYICVCVRRELPPQ